MNATSVIPLIAATFLASLLGSLHCAGMCGGFMAFALSPSPSGEGRSGVAKLKHSRANPFTIQGAYHLGRLVTYCVLGAIAGSVGAAVDHTGQLAGLQRAAASLAGALMVVFGLITLLRVLGVRIMQAPAPEPLRRLLVRGHAAAFELPPVQRAATVGLLTTLLPCGWLYAFAISAAGTGSPLWGAAAMAVFWLGTLPVMLTLGAGIQSLTGALKQRLPLLTALAVVAVGMFTVIGRFVPHHHELPGAAMILPTGGGSHARCGP
jgi:sulfite exporter TauE/SafE